MGPMLLTAGELRCYADMAKDDWIRGVCAEDYGAFARFVGAVRALLSHAAALEMGLSLPMPYAEEAGRAREEAREEEEGWRRD